ncbi:Terminal uridylyltransferase 4 [Haplosporangium sp. Z 11]|nr:Terminal uridylyltransferase 4 [Haplosporangium sp. Z 11]
MAATPQNTPLATTQQDEDEFIGILYDTILFERACHRLNVLKKYDFPLKYDELAYDFLAAYRLCLERKFIKNKNTAVFSQFIVNSKLIYAKGVRSYAQDHLGRYEIFPADSPGPFDYGDEDEIQELDEQEFSDFDEIEHGLRPTKKKVGYEGPKLSTRRPGGRGYAEQFAEQYYVVDKHSQDMIAVIIAHLRKRVWYHEGSGGDVVEIRGMGAEYRKETDGRGGQDDDGGKTQDPSTKAIAGVKGVKKYTRRFNGKFKRRNYERRRQDRGNGFMFGSQTQMDPPTDYTDSDVEAVDKDDDMQRIEEAISRMAAATLMEYTGSAKRKVHWLVPSKSEPLYDWSGVNKELRLIDLPEEDTDPAFYGCLTRDIMNKYKKLLPPPELLEKHKELTNTLQNIIATSFPEEDLKVEPYGSFVSGLLMEHSDADFCINGPNIHEHQVLNDMERLCALLKVRGKMHNVVAVPDATVPIVKFHDPVSQLECDINTGNNLGVVNSELIRIYILIDERVKPFLYMIKAICKAQGINDARSGYLSSYAITWMGIVFLQQGYQGTSSSSELSSTPTLPRLQQQPFERMAEMTLRTNHNMRSHHTIAAPGIDGRSGSGRSEKVHCRFDNNRDGRHTGTGRANPKSLARLLIEFFEFFSRRFYYAGTAIHVARGQIVAKTNREVHSESARVATFRIVDPFLHHRNITGTCRGETLERVWRAFDHSYRMLSAGDLEGAMVTVE